MQYVEVAVNTKISKTDQLFTYSIPPQFLPYIRPGILVGVPFRNQKLPGVILELKKNISNQLKSKIKPLGRLLTQYPIISDAQLQLAKWLSRYYFAPLGQAISFMMPPIYKSISINANKLEHVLSKTRQHNIYTLYGNREFRYKNYAALILKVSAKNQQVLILFSDREAGFNFAQFLQKYFAKNKVALIYSGKKSSQKSRDWLEIRNGSKKIIIGTRSTIFSPFNNLGLIIIDQPENYGYKEEQILKYDTLLVAKKLSELNHNHLIIGSDIKTVENLYLEKKKNYKILKNSVNFDNKTINLVDSSKDRGYISWQLRTEIEHTLKENKKALILVNKRGEGSYLGCNDCGFIFNCPNCNLPLTPYLKNGDNLQCAKCNYSANSPEKCPKCAGTKLKNIGLGVEKIAQEIKKIFPNTDNIIIGTQKILDAAHKNVQLAAIIGIDNILSFPDYKNTEKALILISKLLAISQSKLLIQTYNIESQFMQLIKTNNFSKILEMELNNRKTSLYPPYVQLAKLIYKDQNEKKCQQEAENIFQLLRVKTDKNTLEIIDPCPCFISKKRNYFCWQIIIKNKKYAGLDDFKISKLLDKIPLKEGWRVEIDPLNLL